MTQVLNKQPLCRWLLAIWLYIGCCLSQAMAEDFDCDALRPIPYPVLDPQAEAWFQQAKTLEIPRGEAIDYVQVASLYQKAADQGHWKAMNNLALMRFAGQGIEEDEDQAAELILAMQQYDIPESYRALAYAYEHGIGSIKRNKEKMHVALDKAAEFADPKALANKGNANMYSGDWDKLREAIELLECALSMGHAEDDAALNLSTAYLFEKRHKEYYGALIRGTNLNNPTSLGQLEALFRLGKSGFPKDTKRAACMNILADKFYEEKGYTLPDDIRTLCPANFPLPYDIEGG